MERERLPDVFFSRDFPVLLAIAKWDLAGRDPYALSHDALLNALPSDMNFTANEVVQIVERLHESDYVEAAFARGAGMHECHVKRLLERGRREVGAWPHGDDLAGNLTALLEARATELDRTEPEKGRKVRAIASALGDLGTDFAAKLAAELLKGLATPH